MFLLERIRAVTVKSQEKGIKIGRGRNGAESKNIFSFGF